MTGFARCGVAGSSARSGFREVLKPTEPKKGATVGMVLRPSHKFSKFWKTFSLGLTFHLREF